MKFSTIFFLISKKPMGESAGRLLNQNLLSNASETHVGKTILLPVL